MGEEAGAGRAGRWSAFQPVGSLTKRLHPVSPKEGWNAERADCNVNAANAGDEEMRSGMSKKELLKLAREQAIDM